jgi:hypothetical protein
MWIDLGAYILSSGQSPSNTGMTLPTVWDDHEHLLA